MNESDKLPLAAVAAWIDIDYRQNMLEAAGSDVVLRLTQACFEESQALIQRVLPQIAAPSTGFPAAEVMACHRLAGSCAAVGLKAMGQAWYALEQAAVQPSASPPPGSRHGSVRWWRPWRPHGISRPSSRLRREALQVTAPQGDSRTRRPEPA